VLLLLFGLVALSSFLIGAEHFGHTYSRTVGYVLIVAIEWLIVAFIALGARWGGGSLHDLAGGLSMDWRSLLRDLGLAVAYLIVANPILGVIAVTLGRLGHPASQAGVRNLLPHTGLESAAYLFVALTAGICEEMIFRGYLQRQFTAWTRNATAGILLQGILFGAAHNYQGSTMMTVIAVYGCMFGLLALWRKSLRPGIFAHFIQDALVGLVLARYALK
jgi:hypothetical protein